MRIMSSSGRWEAALSRMGAQKRSSKFKAKNNGELEVGGVASNLRGQYTSVSLMHQVPEGVERISWRHLGL